MIKILALFMLTLSLVNAQTITIAVAANVSYAIKDLVKEFSKTHEDIKIRVTLGSSGKLTAQIKHGAPYDLFMSANMQFPDALYKDSLAITKPKVYALGSIALLSNKKISLDDGILALTNIKISKIAVANPKTAPYGIAAKEALVNAGIYDKLKGKFIYGESISQTISYAVIAADMGIVANSSLYSSNMSKYKEGIDWVAIDTKLYTPIKQGVVILKKAKSSKAVKSFYNFIFSKEAKKIFKKYGYLTL